MKRIGLLCILLISLLSMVHAQEEPVIPDPAPLVEQGDDDIFNILLIGLATEGSGPGLADSILLASINRTAGSVSVISIPRDLYVYVPSVGMKKINQAYYYGTTGEEPVGGAQLLKETVLYNLGVRIDRTATINFTRFGRLIDRLGGIRISVDCAIEDWRLTDPTADKQNPDNWYMYTLRPGVHWLDGDLALWYVRSRRTSNDLDRGRRQQDVLRAIWRRLQSRELLADLPALWGQVNELVETDITLEDVLNLAPLATRFTTADVQYYTFEVRTHINTGYTPGDGRFIFEMVPDAVYDLMQQLVRPPTVRRITQQLPSVAIVNVTGLAAMGQVAADRLELEGFRTIVLDERTSPRQFNKVIDYTGADKGNPIGAITRVFRISDEGIEISPQADREYDYKLYLGARYLFTACTRPVIQPPWEAEENNEDS